MRMTKETVRIKRNELERVLKWFMEDKIELGTLSVHRYKDELRVRTETCTGEEWLIQEIEIDE